MSVRIPKAKQYSEKIGCTEHGRSGYTKPQIIEMLLAYFAALEPKTKINKTILRKKSKAKLCKDIERMHARYVSSIGGEAPAAAESSAAVEKKKTPPSQKKKKKKKKKAKSPVRAKVLDVTPTKAQVVEAQAVEKSRAPEKKARRKTKDQPGAKEEARRANAEFARLVARFRRGEVSRKEFAAAHEALLGTRRAAAMRAHARRFKAIVVAGEGEAVRTRKTLALADAILLERAVAAGVVPPAHTLTDESLDLVRDGVSVGAAYASLRDAGEVFDGPHRLAYLVALHLLATGGGVQALASFIEKHKQLVTRKKLGAIIGAQLRSATAMAQLIADVHRVVAVFNKAVCDEAVKYDVGELVANKKLNDVANLHLLVESLACVNVVPANMHNLMATFAVDGRPEHFRALMRVAARAHRKMDRDAILALNFLMDKKVPDQVLWELYRWTDVDGKGLDLFAHKKYALVIFDPQFDFGSVKPNILLFLTKWFYDDFYALGGAQLDFARMVATKADKRVLRFLLDSRHVPAEHAAAVRAYVAGIDDKKYRSFLRRAHDNVFGRVRDELADKFIAFMRQFSQVAADQVEVMRAEEPGDLLARAVKLYARLVSDFAALGIDEDEPGELLARVAPVPAAAAAPLPAPPPPAREVAGTIEFDFAAAGLDAYGMHSLADAERVLRRVFKKKHHDLFSMAYFDTDEFVGSDEAAAYLAAFLTRPPAKSARLVGAFRTLRGLLDAGEPPAGDSQTKALREIAAHFRDFRFLLDFLNAESTDEYAGRMSVAVVERLLCTLARTAEDYGAFPLEMLVENGLFFAETYRYALLPGVGTSPADVPELTATAFECLFRTNQLAGGRFGRAAADIVCNQLKRRARAFALESAGRDSLPRMSGVPDRVRADGEEGRVDDYIVEAVGRNQLDAVEHLFVQRGALRLSGTKGDLELLNEFVGNALVTHDGFAASYATKLACAAVAELFVGDVRRADLALSNFTKYFRTIKEVEEEEEPAPPASSLDALSIPPVLTPETSGRPTREPLPIILTSAPSPTGGVPEREREPEREEMMVIYSIDPASGRLVSEFTGKKQEPVVETKTKKKKKLVRGKMKRKTDQEEKEEEELLRRRVYSVDPASGMLVPEREIVPPTKDKPTPVAGEPRRVYSIDPSSGLLVSKEEEEVEKKKAEEETMDMYRIDPGSGLFTPVSGPRAGVPIQPDFAPSSPPIIPKEMAKDFSLPKKRERPSASPTPTGIQRPRFVDSTPPVVPSKRRATPTGRVPTGRVSGVIGAPPTPRREESEDVIGRFMARFGELKKRTAPPPKPQPKVMAPPPPVEKKKTAAPPAAVGGEVDLGEDVYFMSDDYLDEFFEVPSLRE